MRVVDVYRVGKQSQRTQTRKYDNVARKRPDAIKLDGDKPRFKLNLSKKSESYPVYKNQLKTPFPQQHSEKPLIKSTPDQVPAREDLQNPKLKKALQVYQHQMGVGQPSKILEVFLAEGVTPGSKVGRKSQLERFTQKRKEAHKKELWKTYNRKHMVYIDDEQIATKVMGYKTGELISVMI